MARAKAGLNRSEAIREAFKALPSAKAKEIVSYLRNKGIEVTEGLVYQVKKVEKSKNRKKPGRKPGFKVTAARTLGTKTAAAPSSNGKLSVGASITLVKATADKVGGWNVLKEIVDALA
jgi:hypothetical protein